MKKREKKTTFAGPAIGPTPRPRGAGSRGCGVGHGFELTPEALLAAVDLRGCFPPIAIDLVCAQAVLGPDAPLAVESGGEAAIADPDTTKRTIGR